MLDGPRLESRQKYVIHLFSQKPRQALRPTQPHIDEH
jgi:hypothetical protein